MGEGWPDGIEWERGHKVHLNLKSIYDRTRIIFGDVELADPVDEKGLRIFRYTYADAWKRMCRVANVLKKLGVKQQEHVGVFAWNHHRHFELLWAIPGYGAVFVGINSRLLETR
ncbi:MAG: AMP-binding protein [Thermodesulfobacteriota bacterium]|nr:AMP-binding protein [Thermodesulfobacteriota bacterium]